MKEIEVKILDVNKKEIEKKLLELGAKKVFDGELYAKSLDYEDKRFDKEKKLLRLRKEGKQAVLTLKKLNSKVDVKIADEYETEVSDFDETLRLLEMLGLKEKKVTTKHRTSYKLNGVKFEFDTYVEKDSFIPTFLEIEAEDKEKIFVYAKKLGFNKEDCKPWSYRDLIKIYKKN